MFALPNTAGIKRLTIGVTNADGKRAEIKFIAPDFSRDNPTAPLLAVNPQTPNTHAPQTVRCPVCGKWSNQDGTRYYHLETILLATGQRDDSRSLWCNHNETAQ